jgi:hypothetical protein
MPEKSKPPKDAKADTSATARTSIAKMSRAEIREIKSLLAYTIAEGDFPKFRRALFKLGYDENSADYQASTLGFGSRFHIGKTISLCLGMFASCSPSNWIDYGADGYTF